MELVGSQTGMEVVETMIMVLAMDEVAGEVEIIAGAATAGVGHLEAVTEAVTKTMMMKMAAIETDVVGTDAGEVEAGEMRTIMIDDLGSDLYHSSR